MSRSTATSYELERRYGIGQIRSIQFGLSVFSLICGIWHACAIGFCLVASLHFMTSIDLEAYLEAASLVAGFFAILFNRPAMYFALETWTAIESAISRSRGGHTQGWAMRFMKFMPWSLFIPPGDLLAVFLLLLRIRANSDHLNLRQIGLFDRCELAFGSGAVVQYVGFVLLIAFVAIAGVGNEAVAFSMFISSHTLMLGGIFLVAWSSRTVCRELRDVVSQTHWDQDASALYFANLDGTNVPTQSHETGCHDIPDGELDREQR
ncbi:MAG: hypothetical protein U0941_23565 [Planctomycetaceae bacterium]